MTSTRKSPSKPEEMPTPVPPANLSRALADALHEGNREATYGLAEACGRLEALVLWAALNGHGEVLAALEEVAPHLERLELAVYSVAP